MVTDRAKGRQWGMQSYPLDLATILYLLSQQRQSGQLQAELEEVPGSREPCLARLVLVDGKVVSCLLTTRRGVELARGERALRILNQLGVIEWIWQTGAEEMTQPASSPELRGLSAIPRRLVPLSPQILQRCSRVQRRVLSLVDGRRTIGDIATVLAVPSGEIDSLMAVLHELQAMRLIVLDG